MQVESTTEDSFADQLLECHIQMLRQNKTALHTYSEQPDSMYIRILKSSDVCFTKFYLIVVYPFYFKTISCLCSLSKNQPFLRVRKYLT